MMLEYKRAKPEDSELLIQIFNEAFHGDYLRYGACPAYGHTDESISVWIRDFPIRIIFADGIPVGAITWFDHGNGAYYLGNLCVLPAFQRRGIGASAIQYMQSVCGDWQEISLHTPADNKSNIHFYRDKCRFTMGETEMDGSVRLVRFTISR